MIEYEDYEKYTEQMFDKFGLINAINTIAAVCFNRAQRIREIWEDEPMAKIWESNANKLIKCITKLDARI